MSQATHFEVQKSTDNTNWVTVAVITVGTTSYYHENKSNSGIAQYFRVRAVITGVPQTSLPMQSAYTSSSNTTCTYPESAQEDNFEVYVSTDGAVYTLYSSPAQDSTEEFLTNRTPEQVYWVKVRAYRRHIPQTVSLSEYSAYSNIVNMSCTFYESIELTTFPAVNPSYSVVEGLLFNTAVIGYGNKIEQRFSVENTVSKKFKLSWGLLSSADKDAIRSFFTARRGSLEAFKWLNPVDSVVYTVRFAVGIIDINYFDLSLWSINSVDLIEVIKL